MFCYLIWSNLWPLTFDLFANHSVQGWQEPSPSPARHFPMRSSLYGIDPQMFSWEAPSIRPPLTCGESRWWDIAVDNTFLSCPLKLRFRIDYLIISMRKKKHEYWLKGIYTVTFMNIVGGMEKLWMFILWPAGYLHTLNKDCALHSIKGTNGLTWNLLGVKWVKWHQKHHLKSFI